MDNLNSLPAVIFDYHFSDDQLAIDTINSTVIAMLGISPDKCYRHPDYFLQTFATEAKAVEQALRDCSNLRCPLQLEIPFADKYLLLQLSPVESSPLAATGLLVDISVQHQAQETAIQKIKFLTFVQDQLQDLFYYKDKNSRFLGGNLAWSRYHGETDPEVLIGKSDLDSKKLSPEIKQALFNEEQELMKNGKSIRRREHRVNENDMDEYYESVKTPLFDKNGEVIGLVGITRNITTQVNAELTLRKAREQAEHLAQAKSSFLAVMSHEIRTPMNGVIGCASLLNETELNNEQRQLLRTIQSSGESLLVIINDILDYSKIEAGKMEFDKSHFDLRTLIEECLELFGKQVNEKGLEINYLLAADLPSSLIGDSSRIRQVINNLLGNAIKFTEQGEVFTEVSLLQLDSETKTCEILISIKDTGIGIAKDNQAQLFNAFSQADTSITRRYGGTGLGLAISKKIAEQMGGRLWFESEPQKGSTFYFSLKLEYDDQALLPDLMQEIEDVKGLNVLIVDDNATNRRVLSNTLLRWGMNVFSFDSPKTVLENLYLGQNYDLAVLDFCMPNMNGGDLAREIRQQKFMQSKPIIILSSAQIDKTELGNADTILIKPVRTNTLKRCIMQLLGREDKKISLSSIQPSEHRNTRILVVEDNSVNQMVVTMMLKKLGYQNISCVADGQEAVDAIDHRELDIILMDIQMDRMDGYTATRIIRSKKRATNPWIIALTAGVQAEDSDKAYQSGMNDFLTKPVQLKQLEAVLIKAEKEILKLS